MSDLNTYTHAMAIDNATGKPMPKVAAQLNTGTFVGMSTDTKPTAANTGDSFLELDTKDVYIYYNAGWVKY